MPDAGRGLRVEDVAGRGLEELQHGLVLERRRVRHVDDDRGAGERVGESFAGEGVDAGLGDAGTASWPCACEFSTTFEPMSPVPPMTTIFMTMFLSGGRPTGAGAVDDLDDPRRVPSTDRKFFLSRQVFLSRMARMAAGAAVIETPAQLAAITHPTRLRVPRRAACRRFCRQAWRAGSGSRGSGSTTTCGSSRRRVCSWRRGSAARATSSNRLYESVAGTLRPLAAAHVGDRRTARGDRRPGLARASRRVRRARGTRTGLAARPRRVRWRRDPERRGRGDGSLRRRRATRRSWRSTSISPRD